MAFTAEKEKQAGEHDMVEQDDGLDHLRADVTGTMAGANPNDPNYLGKIDSSLTALGHIDRIGSESRPDVSQSTMAPPTMSAVPAAAPTPSSATGHSTLDDALTSGAPPAMGAPKKPGVLGRIGHVAARMGNIAGDILAPGLMAITPGTDLYKRIQEQGREERSERERGLTVKETTANAEKLSAETRAKLEPSEAEKNLAEAFKDRLTPEAKTDFELWRNQNPGAPVSDWLKLVSENKPDKNTKDDKDIADYIAANNLPDTPANREKARAEIAKRAPAAHVAVEGTGSFMPLYDDKGKVVGSWNSKTGQITHAPTLPGTTSAGSTIASKADAAAEKKVAPLKAAIAEVETARDLKTLGDKGNAEADVGLVLAFFKAMRGATGPGGPGGGIRFTQQEQKLIMDARSFWGSLQVVGNKVLSNGEPLSRNQRGQVMDVIELYGKAAQRALDAAQGKGGSVTYVEGTDTYDIPADKAAAFEKSHPKAQKQ